MASEYTSTDVIIVYAPDAEGWPSHLQTQLKPVTGGLLCAKTLLKADTRRAALDSLVLGKLVIVLVTPELLDTLYADTSSTAVDFKVAGQCLVLLCGTDLTDFSEQLLCRCFRDPVNLSIISHTQIDSLVSRTEALLPDVSPMLPFDLIPTTVFCEHATMVTASFREVDVSKRRFTVKVGGVEMGPTVCINRPTQCFTAPADQAGEVLVHVMEGSTLIGVRRLMYVSDSSRDGTQQISLQLLNTLSELLVTAGVSSNKLDDAVDKVMDTAPPHTYQQLFSRFVSGKNQYEEELPSLLHWCAKYGLTKVNSRLLKLPYAGLATCVTNSQGYSPADLARFKRNSDIARTIDDQQNTDKWYADMFTRIRSMLSEDDLHLMDSYYTMDSIYANYSDVALVQEEHYLKMTRTDTHQLVPQDDDEIYTQPDVDSTFAPVTVPGEAGFSADIFRWSPEERDARLKDSMAPHLQELISIIEAVKGDERTIDEAEKLFRSWQDMYQRKPSVKKRPAKPPPAADGEDTKPSLLQKMRHAVWRNNSKAVAKQPPPLSIEPPVLVPRPQKPKQGPTTAMNGHGTLQGQGQPLPAPPVLPPRPQRQLSSVGNTKSATRRPV